VTGRAEQPSGGAGALSARRALRRPVQAWAVGLPTRLLASLLDALLPTGLTLVLLRSGTIATRGLARYPDLLPLDSALRTLYEDPGAYLWPPTVWMVLFTMCSLAQLGTVRTTLGKRLLGLSVRQRDGALASAPRRLARVAACWLVPASLGLAYLWIAVNPERRGWHDVLSATWVVRVRPEKGARSSARG
jgi:uncharacterized RDD family membrane protein YckC